MPCQYLYHTNDCQHLYRMSNVCLVPKNISYDVACHPFSTKVINSVDEKTISRSKFVKKKHFKIQKAKFNMFKRIINI